MVPVRAETVLVASILAPGNGKQYPADDNNPNSLEVTMQFFRCIFDEQSALDWHTRRRRVLSGRGTRAAVCNVEGKRTRAVVNNVVHAVLEDAFGVIYWMSTHQGLSRMTVPSAQSSFQKPLATDAAKACYRHFGITTLVMAYQNNGVQFRCILQRRKRTFVFYGFARFLTTSLLRLVCESIHTSRPLF